MEELEIIAAPYFEIMLVAIYKLGSVANFWTPTSSLIQNDADSIWNLFLFSSYSCTVVVRGCANDIDFDRGVPSCPEEWRICFW